MLFVKPQTLFLILFAVSASGTAVGETDPPVKVLDLIMVPRDSAVNTVPEATKRNNSTESREETDEIVEPLPLGATKPLGYISVSQSYFGSQDGYTWSGKEYPAYDRPGGERTGTFIVTVGMDTCLNYPSVRGRIIRPSKRETIRIAKCHLFYYYERAGDYFRVLDRSVPEGIWIPLKHKLAENSDMEVTLYPIEMLQDLDRVSSFRFQNYNGYVLRDSPAADGRVLLTLDERRHAIAEFTGETYAGWAKAEIYEISGYPESCFSKESLEPHKTNSFTGWLKILEADGVPGKINWGILC